MKNLAGYKPETWSHLEDRFRLFYTIDEIEKIEDALSIEFRENAYYKIPS